MIRILTGIFLFASIFFAPWAFVFAGVILAAAIFSWYFEAFIIGIVMALTADMALWKIFLIFGLVILAQEKIKLSMNFGRFSLAVFWLWLVGIAVFSATFLVFI
ncbi:MAG: hypothetical protein HYY55_00375 [Candidatus Niyogibacteria bacterium]|nr:MAG: hypothetical protein HYY55_00375 [Candidatus Niyogibacteria bacterium]